MKKIRLAASAAAAALALSLPLLTQAAQVQLSVLTEPNPVLPGETSVVTVQASYDGTDLLLGGAFSLDFDARLLEVVDVTLIAPRDIAGTTGSVEMAGDIGTVAGVGFASFSGVGGTFEIAAVKFRAIGPLGASTLTAYDADDVIFAWASESLQPVTVLGASNAISVSVVPEPASMLMLLVGAGVIGLSTRRRR
jgi:PEP-CTERM motif